MANICEKCTHRNVCRYQEPCEECNQFAEEVVRCKDCKHYMLWEDSEDKRTCGKAIGLMISAPDDFCSYGKRREGE